MANKIIRMSVLRNIISLKKKGLSNRSISGQLGLSRKTTNKYINTVEQTGFSYQHLLELSDAELAALVEPSPQKLIEGYLEVLYSYRFGGPISNCRERAQTSRCYPLPALAGIQAGPS